ncbi:DNA cytosine methyltransferase [Chitinophaga rhizosphaerae]|uniref:DNA cytosine methyltransferase n=1 Tax=Chitinophaga rhizosphaerae TaxID=1864947 RepID=UPI000F8027EE|nr:DNA cytosine methyltransferase [Chitinophaga rhizosphaerae]
MKFTEQQYRGLIEHCLLFEVVAIDLFAGAGGVSFAIENARTPDGSRFATVAACVNHDAWAIRSHAMNMPHAIHLNEDIRTVELGLIVQVVEEIRRRKPRIQVVLWASPSCPGHSVALGGRSRDEDSRSLAEHLIRYILAIRPNKIMVENVREFEFWGPLVPKITFLRDSDGFKREICPLVVNKKANRLEPWMVPDPEKRGENFSRWIREIEEHGYCSSWRVLNCADFGCPTIRKRLFVQFSAGNGVITWPVPTHSKNGDLGRKRWVAVRNFLDVMDTGESIFKDGRISSEATFRRLEIGARKFCLQEDNLGTTQFLDVQYGNGFAISLDAPATTLTTKDRLSLVTLVFDEEFITWAGQVQSGIFFPSPPGCAKHSRSGNVGRTLNYPHMNSDSPAATRLKKLMAESGIIDIRSRHLTDIEFRRITTLPDNYLLLGGITRSKKFIGNAVPAEMVRVLFESAFTKNRHI